MVERRQVDFLVVGGGIGGAAVALALARCGHSVHILEKAPEFKEIGAGIQVSPNASRVLDRLGVLGRVTEKAFFPSRLVLMDALSAERITALETGDAFGRRYGYRYCVTHRADLHRSLVEACHATGEVAFDANKEAIHVDSFPDRAVVTCSDGSMYDSRAVIGADGLRSVVREKLIDDGGPVDSGYVSYRGTKPMDEMRSEAAVEELDDMVIWTGPGIHLVQYPVRQGELCNQVATLDTRAFPCADAPSFDQQLDQAFADTCPRVKSGIRVMDRSQRWDLVDRLPATGWSHGRITLLGDAAHPMLQYVAQGACQSIEDAAALADNLTKHGGSITPAFEAFEAERFPRTSRVQTTARQFGEVLHIGGVGASMRTALLRQRRTDDYTITDWLYGHNSREVAA